MRFPTTRPNGANYVRPRRDEALEITPPGFCWWRAAERGACQYRLVVTRDGAAFYASPLTPVPIHVPDRGFPPGPYAWTVEAVADGGRVEAVLEARTFSIAENAPEWPWVDPRVLLDRVPTTHPRLFFLAGQLDEVRQTLPSGRAEASAALKQMADAGLSVEPFPEPDYDRIADPAARRLAYFDCFRATRHVHDQAMRAMALMYLLTGERAYGERAKALIVDAAGWDPEGISSILAPYGDEVGLGLLRAGAEVYASTALTLRQTDEWPIAPDEGYPTLSRPLPAKRWHLTAQTGRASRVRIASLVTVQGPGEAAPDLRVSAQDSRVAFQYGENVRGWIDLSPDSRALLEASCGEEHVEVEA